MYRTSRLFGVKSRSAMEDLDEVMDEISDEEWEEYEERRGIAKNSKVSASRTLKSIADSHEPAGKKAPTAFVPASQVSSSTSSQANYHSAKEDITDEIRVSDTLLSTSRMIPSPRITPSGTASAISPTSAKSANPSFNQPKSPSRGTSGNLKRRSPDIVDEHETETTPAKRRKVGVANLAGSPLQSQSLPFPQPSAHPERAASPSQLIQPTQSSRPPKPAEQSPLPNPPKPEAPNSSYEQVNIVDVDALPEELIQQLSHKKQVEGGEGSSSGGIPSTSTAKASEPPPTITTAIVRAQMMEKAKAEAEAEALKELEQSKKTNKGGRGSKPKKISQKEQQRLDKERSEREKKMNHKDYIAALPYKFPEEIRNIDPKDKNKRLCQCLTGMMIFFAEYMHWNDHRVKEKLDLLYQHGADISVAYDSRVVTHIVSDGKDKDHPAYVDPRLGLPVQLIPLKVRIMKWKWIGFRMRRFVGATYAERVENAKISEAKLPEDLYVHPDRFRREKGLPPLQPGERVRSGIGRDGAPNPPPKPPPRLIVRKKKWKDEEQSPVSDWEMERDKKPGEKKPERSGTKGIIKLKTPSPSPSPSPPESLQPSVPAHRSGSISPFASPSSNLRREQAIRVTEPIYNQRADVDAKVHLDDYGKTSRKDSNDLGESSDHEYVSKRAAKSKGKQREQDVDPLAEFYEQAAQTGSDEEDGDYDRMSGKKINLEAFQCMPRPGGPNACVNQDVIDKLSILQSIHKSRPSNDESWKGFAYQKALGAIRRYPHRIESFEEAKSIPGVGDKMAAKIMEIIETGDLQRIKFERDEATVVGELFRGIYGVGPNVATQWYQMGLRSLRDVEERKFGLTLTPAQEIGLKYYDDINTRMPRQEAKDIYDKIHALALKIDPKLQLEIMGSYRRGSETCGDLDILLTRDPSDEFDHSGVLPKLIQVLHKRGILIADLGGEMGGGLEAKYMGVCRFSPDSKARRIDILCIPFEQWGGALLYFTGDDIFNRSMRLLARKKGMSLNQRGLFKDPVRDLKTKKTVCEGTLIASRTEKEIFSALGVPWQEPHQRIRA